MYIFTALSKLRTVLFLVLFVTFFVCFFFVNQISREWLNGFVPNSQGRRVWSLAWTSLTIKVKGQGHQRPKMCCAIPSPQQHTNGPFCCMTHCNMLAANAMQQQMGSFCRCWGVVSADCMRFMFGKTSLALVLKFI